MVDDMIGSNNVSGANIAEDSTNIAAQKQEIQATFSVQIDEIPNASGEKDSEKSNSSDIVKYTRPVFKSRKFIRCAEGQHSIRVRARRCGSSM